MDRLSYQKVFFVSSSFAEGKIATMNTYQNEIKEIVENMESLRVEVTQEEKVAENFDSKLTIPLFPHQKDSVKNMEKLEKEKNVSYYENNIQTQLGILGDIPGYGKSYSMISLIARDMMECKSGDWIEKRRINDFVTLRVKNIYIKETILIVSTSILEQWKKYFTKSVLKVYTVTTSKNINDFKVGKFDVVIVTHTMYNKFVSIHNYMWKRFVYDEPDTVHIPNMKDIRAGFYWFITATSASVFKKYTKKHFFSKIFPQTNIDDISGYLVEYLPYLTIKNDPEYIKACFTNKPVNFITHECFNPAMLNVVSSHLSENVKLMIEAGDIKGAIEALGGNVENNNIFDIVISKKMQQLQDSEMRIKIYEKSPKDKKLFLEWKQRYTVFDNEIKQIRQKYTEMLKDDCSICCKALQNPILMNCCLHIFCGNCILEWSKQNPSCPMCRGTIKFTELKIVSLESESKDLEQIKKVERVVKHGDGRLIKPEILRNIIKEALEEKNRRIIIFSDYEESYYVINTCLKENNIAFTNFNGTIGHKRNILKNYVDGLTPIIFFNTKNNCSGINLEMTTDIILYHTMSPSVKQQIIARADRIGRINELNVHEFTDKRSVSSLSYEEDDEYIFEDSDVEWNVNGVPLSDFD